MNCISIIIPTFNNQNIIEEIKQKIYFCSSKYKQIIVIDDCSIDATYDELLDFKNTYQLNNVELYKNELNKGPSYSRNVGLKKATGEYIAFLDSDDDWHPQKIDVQIKFMKENNFVLCATEHKIINSDSELNFAKHIDYTDVQTIPYIVYKWPNNLFKSVFATPSVVMHKNIAEKYLFNENIRYSEDYNLWKRISYNNNAAKILFPLTYTFKHDYISSGKSLSSNLCKMQNGLISSYLDLIRSNEIKNIDKLIILFFAIPFSYMKFLRRIALAAIYKLKTRNKQC